MEKTWGDWECFWTWNFDEGSYAVLYWNSDVPSGDFMCNESSRIFLWGNNWNA